MYDSESQNRHVAAERVQVLVATRHHCASHRSGNRARLSPVRGRAGSSLASWLSDGSFGLEHASPKEVKRTSLSQRLTAPQPSPCSPTIVPLSRVEPCVITPRGPGTADGRKQARTRPAAARVQNQKCRESGFMARMAHLDERTCPARVPRYRSLPLERPIARAWVLLRAGVALSRRPFE